MRKFIALIFICFFTFSLTCQAAVSANTEAKEDSSAVIWSNQETGYYVIVEDDADLLSADQESLLITEMQKITIYGNAAFKSISSNNYTTASFAESYYYELFGSASGILFLIDMDNRELYLFSNGAINRTITSSYAYTITDNVYRYASNGDYYRCASAAYEQIHTLLSGRRIAQPMKYISNALLALILAALLNYFIVRLSSSSPGPGKDEILKSISTKFTFTNVRSILLNKKKTYSPVHTGSGNGAHSHGSHSRSGRSSGGGSHSSRGGSSRSHSRGSGGGHRF